MGDRLPSEFVDHLLGLLPDVKVLFQVYLLDALPANARVAALQHDELHAMARAADAVVLENRSNDTDRQFPTVNSLSLLDSDLDGASSFPSPLAPLPSQSVSAVGRPRSPAKKSDLCQIHARYGKESYKCAAPNSCKMRHILRPRPPAPTSSSSAPGNAKAGGH